MSSSVTTPPTTPETDKRHLGDAANTVAECESTVHLEARKTLCENAFPNQNPKIGPGCFQKIRLLGRGDVGRVYLVREKKTDKLFAMKGDGFLHPPNHSKT